MEKALQTANVKLSSALSDIFGHPGRESLTGQAASQRQSTGILAALEGHPLNGLRRMMITCSLDHLRFLDEQILKIVEETVRKIESEGWKQKWKPFKACQR